MSKCIFDLKMNMAACVVILFTEMKMYHPLIQSTVKCGQKAHRLNGNAYLLGKGVGSGMEDKKGKQ